MWQQTIILAIITSSISGGPTQNTVNPYDRDLKLLLQEPPLQVKANRNNETHVQELWLEQKLDHFGEGDNNETWLMRYLQNTRYYKPGSPIFIFVGGEWEISSAYLLTGHMYDLAKEHNGMLYYTEHRYYGQSWPVSNSTSENLRFLSVKQALADLEYFIKHQQATVQGLENSKVVLTGGSYGGTMVAWFNTLYPDMRAVSWASSAPLEAKLDFFEYMEEVGVTFRLIGGRRCYQRIGAGVQGLAKLLRSPNTAEELLRRLRACKSFEVSNELHLAAFFNGISNYFAAMAQSHSKRINGICSKLSLHAEPVEAFVQFLTHIFWPPGKNPELDWCVDFSYEAMLTLFTNTQDRSTVSRQWFYQTCHEFGWYSTTASSQKHPFSREVPLSYFLQMCQDSFGNSSSSSSNSTEAALHEYSQDLISLSVDQTNQEFGKHPYDHVIFTHGQLDPWRAAGLQHGRNVIIIRGHDHAADLGSLSVNDTVAMKVAKLRVGTFIRRFLRDDQV